MPLVRAVHNEVIKAGGFPLVEFQSAFLERDLMLQGNQQQLDWVPEVPAKAITDWADVYIGLRGSRNPSEFSNIPTDKFISHRRAMGEISALRTAHTRWVIARVPNECFAQQAGLGYREAMDMFFAAVLRDWSEESKLCRRLKDLFEGADVVRIIAPETDISFSTKGRTYVVEDGRINMPGGEIYTAPVENSLNGHITFDFPGVYFGQRVENIHMEFSQGKLVKADSSSNQALLGELLRMDEGAAVVGEFGVGTNNGIQSFCADHFYDEKIGGSVHFALGRSYKECGGMNYSALHWDIVKDMRSNGAIHLDGRKVFENGAYLVNP